MKPNRIKEKLLNLPALKAGKKLAGFEEVTADCVDPNDKRVVTQPSREPFRTKPAPPWLTLECPDCGRARSQELKCPTCGLKL